ncbi:hypothetical protein BDR26DRAFT_868229 [Obelidium mucronatum]|nr:hypothetical protein BDR26DRAFT_868229 [Obelidium mucronatum]
MPTEFDNLLKDLDASLDEIKTGSHPNEPKTVSQVLQLPNSLSGTMEVIPPTHPDPLNQTKKNAVPWVPRFFILTSDTLFMFVSSDPAEPVLDQFKITSQTEAIPSLGYLPGNPMAFEVADGFFQKSWILKAPSKTAKDTWMESIRIATPPGRNEDDLYEYLDEYADQDSENTAVSRKQNIQAFKEHQRYRGVPIAISRANSVGSSVQQSFSPPANFQLQLNWERRDSESTFD